MVIGGAPLGTNDPLFDTVRPNRFRILTEFTGSCCMNVLTSIGFMVMVVCRDTWV